jgi:hypothetical protein
MTDTSRTFHACDTAWKLYQIWNSLDPDDERPDAPDVVKARRAYYAHRRKCKECKHESREPKVD